MSVLAPYCSQAPAVADEAPAAHQGGGGMATEPNEAPDSDQDDDAPEIADESDCESLLMSDEDPEQEGEEEEGSGASGGKGSSSRGGKGGGKGRGGGKASGGGGSGKGGGKGQGFVPAAGKPKWHGIDQQKFKPRMPFAGNVKPKLGPKLANLKWDDPPEYFFAAFDASDEEYKLRAANSEKYRGTDSAGTATMSERRERLLYGRHRGRCGHSMAASSCGAPLARVGPPTCRVQGQVAAQACPCIPVPTRANRRFAGSPPYLPGRSPRASHGTPLGQDHVGSVFWACAAPQAA